eukprot:scaffold5079_cov109-Isochrysis_galbana.AAC.4
MHCADGTHPIRDQPEVPSPAMGAGAGRRALREAAGLSAMRRRSGCDAVMPRRRMRPACATMQRATVSAPQTHLSDFDAPHGARQPATELLGGPTEVGEILAELEI